MLHTPHTHTHTHTQLTPHTPQMQQELVRSKKRALNVSGGSIYATMLPTASDDTSLQSLYACVCVCMLMYLCVCVCVFEINYSSNNCAF